MASSKVTNKAGTADKPTTRGRSRTPSSPGSNGSSVSDDTCPICLGNIIDKCVADSCQHCFCLLCLKEWSKQKAVCPLCKESFTTIMYDIKSDIEFKEWKVPRPEPRQHIFNYQTFFVSDRTFFGYRTTNFPGAATLRQQHPGNAAHITDAIPSGPRERRSASYNTRGSSFFRLHIYLNNQWVEPIADITGRYRQSSPELYREQPALTHRLVPWVNRELAALVPAARIGVVLTEVMDLIERHPINSRAFRRAVRPHLGVRTNHFVHEFYHFARSPYDMVGHDNAARYITRYGFSDNNSTESSSSEDSDAVVEIDVRGNPVPLTSRGQQNLVGPSNVEREEILTQEGSVVISSDENSSNETPQSSNLFQRSQTPQTGLSESQNSTGSAVVASSVTRLLGRARNFLSSVNEGASTSVAEESETARKTVKKTLKREISSDSDDSDACIIVEEVSKRQQTPEVVNLDSEDEQEKVGLSSSKKGKNLKSHKEKHQKKPHLNRTNFPLSLSQSSFGGTSRQSDRDHNYCSELENENLSRNKRKTSEIEESVQSGKEQNQELYGSSDNEEDFQHQEKKRVKHKKKKHKQRKTMNACICEDSSQDGGGSSSRQNRNSHSRENISPPRRQRKDHKAKVKKSSWSHGRTSSHETHEYDQACASDVPNSNSDVWTPSSSAAESSSRDAPWQMDESSSHCSSTSRSSQHKVRKGGHSSLKSRGVSRKGKHKKKDKHKEKSKKVKKNKHKKKYKSRKIAYTSSSDSD